VLTCAAIARTIWVRPVTFLAVVAVASAAAVVPVVVLAALVCCPSTSTVSALLRCHHENTAWHEGDLLAPTLRALRFHPFMLGDCKGRSIIIPT
jgi:hypothetical protein